jgi:hypothetical protein
MEIDGKLVRIPASFRYVKSSRLVNGRQALDGLDLEDQLALHDKIESIPTIELQGFVGDGQVNLPFEAQATQAELVSQAALVRRLEQTGTKPSMNLDARSDHRLHRDRIITRTSGISQVTGPSSSCVPWSNTPPVASHPRQ